jgi:hypothetical protein
MLAIHHLPDLRQPAVICAVSGWSDAGSAASGALAYLLGKWSTRRFAEFDSDVIYNYTVTRPATIRAGGPSWPGMRCLFLMHSEIWCFCWDRSLTYAGVSYVERPLA